MKIEESIRQSKFKNEFEKANINLLFTANWLNSSVHQLIKVHDISLQQFNILRILRGQKGKPAPLKLLTERMLDKMSNTSRLVDKMLAKGLLKRQTCPENRRQVDIIITEKGMKTCQLVSDVIDKHRNENQKITEKEARELNRILDKLRS